MDVTLSTRKSVIQMDGRERQISEFRWCWCWCWCFGLLMRVLAQVGRTIVGGMLWYRFSQGRMGGRTWLTLALHFKVDDRKYQEPPESAANSAGQVITLGFAVRSSLCAGVIGFARHSASACSYRYSTRSTTRSCLSPRARHHCSGRKHWHHYGADHPIDPYIPPCACFDRDVRRPNWNRSSSVPFVACVIFGCTSTPLARTEFSRRRSCRRKSNPAAAEEGGKRESSNSHGDTHWAEPTSFFSHLAWSPPPTGSLALTGERNHQHSWPMLECALLASTPVFPSRWGSGDILSSSEKTTSKGPVSWFPVH